MNIYLVLVNGRLIGGSTDEAEAKQIAAKRPGAVVLQVNGQILS